MFSKKIRFLALIIGNMMGSLPSAATYLEETSESPKTSPVYSESDEEEVSIPISSKGPREQVPHELGCEERYFRGVNCCWRISQGWFNAIGALSGYIGVGFTALSTMGNFSQETQVILGGIAIAGGAISAFCHNMDSYTKEKNRNAFEKEEEIISSMRLKGPGEQVPQVPVEIGCEESYFRGVNCCWRISQGWFNAVGAISGYIGVELTALSTMGNFSRETQLILGGIAIGSGAISALCHNMDSYAKERNRNTFNTREMN